MQIDSSQKLFLKYIYKTQTTLKHGIMALRHCIDNWKVSGSNRTSLSAFTIRKPLRVLQKAGIKIMAHGIYTYLFFSYTYTLLFCYKIKSSSKKLSRPSQIASTIMTMNVTCTPNNITHTQKSLHCINFFCPVLA